MRYSMFVLVCIGLAAAANAAPRFTDVTARSGIVIGPNTDVGGTNPHAVAIEDFNHDHRPDIVIATFGAPHVRYFRNDGGLRFSDVTKGSGLESFQGEGTGAAAADFNRDGHLDLYLTSLRNGASRLYQGRGDGTFVDISRQASVLADAPARSCAWCDIDQDGWADLFVTSPSGPNRLYRNSRDGTLTNIAKSAGVELADREKLGCVFGDLDGDGLDDLVVTCYRSQISTVFRNLGGGKFQDVTTAAGLGRKASAVGCELADVFRRGRLDLFITTDSWLSGANYTESELLKQGHTVEPNLLYANDGRGRFTPDTAATLLHKTLSHDVVIEDLDHDGLPEIYIGVDAIPTGNRYATSKGGNPLWTRPDGGVWREVAAEWGVKHEANCVCVPAVDFDQDGDLDLLLVNFYGNVVLYRNNTDDKDWLMVQPVGRRSNPDGIGAKVSVFSEAAASKNPSSKNPSSKNPSSKNAASKNAERRLVGYRQIHAGAGYCRSSPLVAHVGLGHPAESGYRIEVLFPGAKTPVVTEKVKPGQRVIVSE